MTSLSSSERAESLFLLYEQPPANLQRCESSDGIKSIHSSSLTSTTLPNQPCRSYSSQNLTPLKATHTCQNLDELHTFANQYERRLDEHRHYYQLKYDEKMQQMIDIKSSEFNEIKIHYETKLKEYEELNRQLQIHSGQIHEENQRLKIELEHEKQERKREEASAEQRLKTLENEFQHKFHDLKSSFDNEKQEMKKQYSNTYQNLLDETNERLKNLETDYKSQQISSESTIDELDKRLVDLRSNVEYLHEVKQKLDHDKLHLIQTNEQLQIQVQELANKQRYENRNYKDEIQRYENELKSARLRHQSSIDLLEKENHVYKSKSSQTISDFEKKVSILSDKYLSLQKSFETQLVEQQQTYQNNLKQCTNDYEKKLQLLKQDIKDLNQKYHLSIQRNEQLQKDHIEEINRKTEQLKSEYEQTNRQVEEKYRKELEELQSNYDQSRFDLQQMSKLSTEIKTIHEKDKQKLVTEYEQFIRKLEKQYSQKTIEYEKRIEMLVSKTHEQLKSMESEFENRNSKQQSIINDQQKMIDTLKDEQSQMKDYYEKQCLNLSEQSLQEKNEIKAQFDCCMRNLEKNFQNLTTKKEQLEKKLSFLKEKHQREFIECRLDYENNLRGLLTNEIRLDLENTIHSLKQQVIYLQQRIAFLQQELDQYVQVYGHRPFMQTK